MKKIVIYVYEQVDGASEGIIEKLDNVIGDFLWDNNLEFINSLCYDATQEDINEALKEEE